MAVGRPISTQALMSEAPAESALTQGPIFRPPRKYSFSPALLLRKKKKSPTPIMNSR